MYRKSAPAISTTTLPPQNVWLQADGPTSIKCPWCSKWCRLKRRVVMPVHDDFAQFDEQDNNCPGSGQIYDLEPIGAWVRRYQTAMGEVAPRRAGAFGPMGRRQGRVMAKPALPIPVPVCRPRTASGSKAPSLPCKCGQCRKERRLATA